jgi:hypothetical protein
MEWAARKARCIEETGILARFPRLVANGTWLDVVEEL